MAEGDHEEGVSVGAQRVRDHRSRRRAAGLVEVKAWVRATDVSQTWDVLRPLTDEAGRALARHAQQGRTNQIAITLRFVGAPPGRVRRELRERWNLTWDGALGCWRGVVEDAAGMEELRVLAGAHGGRVEGS